MLASERQGKRLCFAQMTAIGPMTSEKSEDWQRFESEQAAMQSPAYYHALSCFEPKPLEAAHA